MISGQFGLGAGRRNELGCVGGHCFDRRAARDLVFAALGLGFAEADDGSVELAFDGSHVAQQRFETFGLGGADEEFEGAGLENGGFVTAGSLETPEAGGDFGNEFGFEGADGGVIGEELVVEMVEVGLVLSRQHHAAAGESMFEAVHARDGFAGVGAGAGGGVFVATDGGVILHSCFVPVIKKMPLKASGIWLFNLAEGKRLLISC
jgi:hypothetical protein